MTAHRKLKTPFLLSRLQPAVVFAISTLLLSLIGWLDYLTGDYSLIIFYTIPVAAATWYLDQKYGLAFVLLAFIVRIVADGVITSFEWPYTSLHCWNLFVEFLLLMLTGLLIPFLKKHLVAKKRLASHDHLTSLLNRHFFFATADTALKIAKERKEPVSLICISFDNLKSINEKLGHSCGDNLLIAAAKAILVIAGVNDVAARFSGGSFIILVPMAGKDKVAAFAEAVHTNLKKLVVADELPVQFSISIITAENNYPPVGEFVKMVESQTHQIKSRAEHFVQLVI